MNAQLKITAPQIRLIGQIAEEILDLGVLSREAQLILVSVQQGNKDIPRRAASWLIDRLREANMTQMPASESQIGYLLGLAERKGVRDRITDTHIAKLNKASAHALIDALLKMEDAPPAETPGPRTKHNPNGVSDGLYRTPSGEIYKVQVAVHGSGQLYAKKLVILESPRYLKNDKVRTHDFVREAGALRKLTPDMMMTEEQAKEFGKLYGSCCNCGITLTKESSINQGFGDQCGRKRGWL